MFHYLLWATGPDHPGFVAAISKALFELKCNLEDSSMMRLGSEFAMFVIFTTDRNLSDKNFSHLRRDKIDVGLKKISPREAKFTPSQKITYMIRVHGQDQPGIVYRVTQCLSKYGFNITDLTTHRTTTGRTPGYILLLEGELQKLSIADRLRKELRKLSLTLKTHISFEPLSSESL